MWAFNQWGWERHAANSRIQLSPSLYELETRQEATLEQLDTGSHERPWCFIEVESTRVASLGEGVATPTSILDLMVAQSSRYD
ncbi:hypothetical protein ElyMa_001749200 [Elysia marginata]|uniref:Uncharacterized protein n=1 Tax=Elysia marginata TaxID=1093978 RepID=A0AAV4EAD9_9GAST|nr:hypothetical protein ElyMa_001749200 [Elysia marginata]